MPGDPESDDVKSINLEIVTDEPVRRNPWRPTVLTIRKFPRICHLVEQGFAISRACEIECITYSRFRFRVARSTRLQERLKEAEATRFNLRHEQALESIMAAGERSWMAHAWWLERNLPHLYALRTVSRDAGDMEQLALCDKISLEQLIFHQNRPARTGAGSTSPPTKLNGFLPLAKPHHATRSAITPSCFWPTGTGCGFRSYARSS